MRNFQGTFETRKRLFISAFSTSMTVPLIFKVLLRFICLSFNRSAPGSHKKVIHNLTNLQHST